MGASSSSPVVTSNPSPAVTRHNSTNATTSSRALGTLRSLRRTGSKASGAAWVSTTLASEALAKFIGSVQERRSSRHLDDLTTSATPTVHTLDSDRLSDLTRLIAEAPQQQPLVVDLGGHTLRGTGLSFTIPRGYVALVNGSISLPPEAQLVVTGWGVCLLGLTITADGEPVAGATSHNDADTAAVRVSGGRVLCDRCTLAGGSLAAGIMVEDGGTAVMQQCLIHERCRHGAVVEGPGSFLKAEGCEFRGNSWVGVALLRGARGELSNCVLLAPGHTGVLVTNTNTPNLPTNAQLHGCMIVACNSYCVHAQGAASVSLEDCELDDSGVGMAAEAAGLAAAACIIVARHCTLRNHQQLAAWAAACAHIQLADCTLSSSRTLHGVQASEGGKLVAERCNISGNAGHGAYARGAGSSVQLRHCILEGNGAGATGQDDGRVLVEP